jgi:hypothetical protein
MKTNNNFVKILALVALVSLALSIGLLVDHAQAAEQKQATPQFMTLRVFAHKEPEEIGYSVRVVYGYGEAISLDEMLARGWEPVTTIQGDDGYTAMVFRSVISAPSIDTTQNK